MKFPTKIFFTALVITAIFTTIVTIAPNIRQYYSNKKSTYKTIMRVGGLSDFDDNCSFRYAGLSNDSIFSIVVNEAAHRAYNLYYPINVPFFRIGPYQVDVLQATEEFLEIKKITYRID